MKCRHVFFIFLGFLICYGVNHGFCIPDAEAPVTIYVPSVGVGSIQAAIDQAEPDDVIGIKDGNYTISDTITVDKSVVIRSVNGADDVTVRFNNNGGTDESVFLVTADHAIIDDITIGGDRLELQYVVRIEADYVTVSDCVIEDAYWTYYGIKAVNSVGTTIKYNEITVRALYSGIEIYQGSDALIKANNIHDVSDADGIRVYYCDNTIVEDNTVIGMDEGIDISNSPNLIIRNNELTNNEGGIYLRGALTIGASIYDNVIDLSNAHGVALYNGPSENVIKDNTITNTVYDAIRLKSYTHDTKDNEIRRNLVQDNGVGCKIDTNVGNYVYLNDFIDNTDQTARYSLTYNSPEQLTYEYDGDQYTGYLGNYWSDYTGVDQLPLDGVGDSTYTDGLNDIDDYPLMSRESHYTLIQSYNLELSEGWNLVSFPVIPSDASVASVMSGISDYSVKSWTGSSYNTPTSFEAGKGYWVKINEAETLILTGEEVETVTLNLETGYNLVGVPNSIVQASDVLDGFYLVVAWTPSGYALSTSFQPGKGYLVLVSSDQTVTLP